MILSWRISFLCTSMSKGVSIAKKELSTGAPPITGQIGTSHKPPWLKVNG